jgi:hypothetical protein
MHLCVPSSAFMPIRHASVLRLGRGVRHHTPHGPPHGPLVDTFRGCRAVCKPSDLTYDIQAGERLCTSLFSTRGLCEHRNTSCVTS